MKQIILKTAKPKKVHELKILIDFLQLAVEVLLQTIPNIHFAASLRTDIERVVHRYEHPRFGFIINRFVDAYRSPSTSVKVLFGLMSATFINVTITLIIILGLGGYVLWYKHFTNTGKAIQSTEEHIKILRDNQQKLEQILVVSRTSQNITPTGSGSILAGAINNLLLIQNNLALNNLRITQEREIGKHVQLIRQLVWAFSAGTLGSIISIFTRIEEFQGRKYSDPLVPFLIGLFKPIIGASFAILFLTLINSQFIIISGVSNTEAGIRKEYLLLSICFVVGFSERLARDAIGRVEDVVRGKQATIQSVQTNALLQETSDGVLVEQSTQEKNIQLQQVKSNTANDVLKIQNNLSSR